jgi:hypothetical protein
VAVGVDYTGRNPTPSAAKPLPLRLRYRATTQLWRAIPVATGPDPERHVEARQLLPRRLLVASRELVQRRLLVAPRELVRRRLPIRGGAQEAHPVRGCEEARRPGMDEPRPPSTAVASTL